MSSEVPPVPITESFNLRAWIQNTVLSLATANTLYLSKRIGDTAQGIITFLTGIKTDSINPTTTKPRITPTSSPHNNKISQYSKECT
jgi:hypothetical protein